MLRQLVQDHPQVGPHRDRLARRQFDLAELLATAGQLGEAAGQVQLEALAIREALVRAEPSVSAYDDALGSDYAEIARLEVNAGRSGEAIRRLEQAGAIYDRLASDNPGKFFARGNRPYFQFLLATALEASGDIAGALRDLPAVSEADGDTAGPLFLGSLRSGTRLCPRERLGHAAAAGFRPRACGRPGSPRQERGRSAPARLGRPLRVPVALP